MTSITASVGEGSHRDAVRVGGHCEHRSGVRLGRGRNARRLRPCMPPIGPGDRVGPELRLRAATGPRAYAAVA
jgi:hypothetical protein